MEPVIRPGAEWKPETPDGFTDVTYETADGIAKITICRPEVRNAFRPRTLFELRDAFEIARDDPDDRRDHPHRRRARRVLLGRRPARARRRRLPRRARHRPPQRARPAGADPPAARSRSIAMVAGYAIGGGHVLHIVCDLTIAADNARFGQTGPRVGQLRRRLRLGPARAHRRPEEGARDLVPLRAVRRAGRARHGPRQQGRAARRPRGRDGRVGAQDAASTRRSRCAC